MHLVHSLVYFWKILADYLYTCGSNHDDGEFAHWGMFQVWAAKYIRMHYPKPWSNAANKLIAFVAGVVSHSISDSEEVFCSVARGATQVATSSKLQSPGMGSSKYLLATE